METRDDDAQGRRSILRDLDAARGGVVVVVRATAHSIEHPAKTHLQNRQRSALMDNVASGGCPNEL